jgi:hypothetical protein
MSDYNPADPGAQNDDSESILRKHLNPAFKGPAWDALVAAMAVGDAFLARIAKLAYDQLFTSTASGKYLDRKAANSGVVRPANIGMTDDVFRQYAIKTTATKLTPQVVLDVLEVFYGSQSVRAWADSASETYTMQDGDDLTILVDGNTTVKVVFAASDFQLPSAAKAVEVAAVINRYFDKVGCRAFAINLTDPQTGLDAVRLFSGTLGLTSSIQVTGGKAQNVLQFPTVLGNHFDAATEINFGPVSSLGKQVIVFTFDETVLGGATVPEPGNYVNLYDTAIQPGNRGSFPLESVEIDTSAGITYITVTVANTTGEVQFVSPGIPGYITDCYFFAATKKNIYASGGRTVVAVQSEPGQFDVVLPATAPVARNADNASYMQLGGTLSLGSTASLTPAPLYRRADGKLVIETATGHGLTVGQQVTLDNVAPSYAADVETTAANSSIGRSSATYKTSAKGLTSGSALRAFSRAVPLTSGQLLLAYGHSYTSTIRSLFNATTKLTLTPATDSFGNTYCTYSAFDPTGFTGAAIGAVVALKGLYAGYALAMGGTTSTTTSLSGPTVLSTCRLFNGTSWSTVTSMSPGRVGHTANTYGTNSVVVAGGVSSGAVVSSSTIYSVSGNTWSAGPALNLGRAMHQSINLADDRILVVGGKTAFSPSILLEVVTNGTPTNTCEIYNGLAWAYTGNMAFARHTFAMCLLPDGRALVAGGYGYNPSLGSTGAYLDTIELFDPATGRWTVVGKMNYARAGASCVYVPSIGKVLIAGGFGTSSSPTTAEYWDVNTGQCSLAPFSTPYRQYGSMVLLDNGLAVEAGGYSTTSFAFSAFVPGLEGAGAGRVNGEFRVAEVPSTTSFVVDAGPSKQYFTASSATITPVKYSGNGVSGPYLLGGDYPAITTVSSTVTSALSANQQYKILSIADASSFPDAEGWLVFNFGTAEQVGPVRYLARISTALNGSQLLLDGKTVLPMDVAAGSTVHLLTGKGIYTGTNIAGSLYITDSSAGRVSAETALSNVLAAGVDVVTTVSYPGDRGLGGEGLPATGDKFSDKVTVWGGNMDEAAAAAREE